MSGRKTITRDMIEACLAKGWAVSQAARHYGFHRKSIEAACERFGIALPMHPFSPQMPSMRRKPMVVFEDNIPDTPPKKKKTNAVWSASPAAIERALEKMQRDKYLKTTSNGDK